MASERKRYEAGILPSEITRKEDYINRREFMRRAGTAAAGVGVALAAPGFVGRVGAQPSGRVGIYANVPGSRYDTDERQTRIEDATTYNNFYEFGAGKSDPARFAHRIDYSPWQIQIGGHVSNPGLLDVDDLLSRYRSKFEERIYRLRCVEAWSMVIPWVGFPLHELLRDYEPTSRAVYVRFETFWDSEKMLRASRSIPYPYVEGLRMDEAMNDLTLVTVGMYGDMLAPANGPPVRLVVPWKYGFKSIKSITRIDFVAKQPTNTWFASQPNEYGFFSNVNPERDHPRWSQRTERRFGQRGRLRTEKYNGYGEWVESMYEGMDLINTYY